MEIQQFNLINNILPLVTASPQHFINHPHRVRACRCHAVQTGGRKKGFREVSPRTLGWSLCSGLQPNQVSLGGLQKVNGVVRTLLRCCFTPLFTCFNNASPCRSCVSGETETEVLKCAVLTESVSVWAVILQLQDGVSVDVGA